MNIKLRPFFSLMPVLFKMAVNKIVTITKQQGTKLKVLFAIYLIFPMIGKCNNTHPIIAV